MLFEILAVVKFKGWYDKVVVISVSMLVQSLSVDGTGGQDATGGIKASNSYSAHQYDPDPDLHPRVFFLLIYSIWDVQPLH